MLDKECRSAICSISRCVNTSTKESMIHEDHRERSLSHRNLHDASDRQSVAGIVNQITFVRFVFLECGTDMDITTLEIMLAKPIYRIRKDQLLNCRRWRGC